MAAVSLFWNINMADMTSRENVLYKEFKKAFYDQLVRYSSQMPTKTVFS